VRQAAHEEAQTRLATAQRDARTNDGVLKFGDLKVVALGALNHQPAFSNEVQMYPLGYTCQLNCVTRESMRASTNLYEGTMLTCTVAETSDGDPEFRMVISFAATGSPSLPDQVTSLSLCLSFLLQVCTCSRTSLSLIVLTVLVG
jgi:hypothetical protein